MCGALVHLQPQSTLTVLCGAEMVLTRRVLTVQCMSLFSGNGCTSRYRLPSLLLLDSQQPQKLTVCIYGDGVETMACQLLGCAQSDGPVAGLLKGDATM